MSFKDMLKREIKFLPMWYVLYSGLECFVMMAQYYTIPGVPDHSFDVFGPGILLTVFFPLLWVCIFAFCRLIASKNKEIADLKEKQKNEEGRA